MDRSPTRSRGRVASRIIALTAAALFGFLAGRSSGPTPPVADAQSTDSARTRAPVADSSSGALATSDSAATYAEMRSVDFRVGEGVALRIRHLVGAMQGRAGVVDFDDKMSFTTWIDSAEVGLTGEDLSNLLNKHVFAYKGAPLKHLKVEMQGTELRQKGVLHKGIDIPFDIIAQVSVTPEGLLRLHPRRTRILGVNGDALMKALGLNLQKLIDLSKAQGVTVKKNDLFIDPARVLPPPVIKGRVVAVRVEGNELVQTYTIPADAPAAVLAAARRRPAIPDESQQHYMYFRGGKLHFGAKLLMTDAEMQVVDEQPADPFDFDLEHYQRQLVAGYSQTLPNMGLEVHMPDAGKVKQVARR